MIPKLFENNEFLIDEKVNLFKFANEYKVFDPNGNQVGMVRQKLPGWQKLLQLLINKKMMPFALNIEDQDSTTLVTIKRGWTFWMSKISILDQNGDEIGTIKQKFKLFKPTFKIFSASGVEVAQITGDWKAWDFVITGRDGDQIGKINKKWAGLGKELFTTADKYHVSISPDYAEDLNKMIILSTAITIDMVLKESE